MSTKYKLFTSFFVMLSLFFLYFVFMSRMSQKPAPNVTLKEAFTLLKGKLKVPDLVYMAFDAENMTWDGKTKKFLITGCSPSLKRTFYMLSNGTKIYPPRNIKTKACNPTLPYNKMLDSPKVLAMLEKATGKSCKYRTVYKMNWDDPEALIMCWDPDKQVAHWQVKIDTLTGTIKEVLSRPPKKEEPSQGAKKKGNKG